MGEANLHNRCKIIAALWQNKFYTFVDEKNNDNFGSECLWARIDIFFLLFSVKTSEHCSRMELINLFGSEGKSRASVLQQRNKTPVMSFSSSLHSSHALTCCPGNLQAPCVSVCWLNTSGGLRNHSVKMMCHQTGLRAHGSIERAGSFPCCTWHS